MTVSSSEVVLQGLGVTKHFGGVQALHALDFELHEGEILGLIGPNGSGKTTLFNVITGILSSTSGDVVFRGTSLTGLSSHTIASYGIQRTFQNLRLFKRLSVLTNVMIGAHLHTRASLPATFARARSFRSAEREAGDSAHRHLAFVGLEQYASESARNLPYGQQKMLEIARALAANPEILLLDEPAAGLNSSEIGALADMIRRIRDEGITVFVVEHNMRLIMNICDRIIVINFGEKIAEGTPNCVQRDPVVQEAYLGT
jgi:branched-chain amino acid transport system ATP-binding protein